VIAVAISDDRFSSRGRQVSVISGSNRCRRTD
jgi:hypothetical protein